MFENLTDTFILVNRPSWRNTWVHYSQEDWTRSNQDIYSEKHMDQNLSLYIGHPEMRIW